MSTPLSYCEEINSVANGYFMSGNHFEALKTYTEAIDNALQIYPNLNSEHKFLGKECISKYFANRAAVFLRMEEYSNALNDAESSLGWNQMNVKARIRKAMAEEATEKWEESLRDYELSCVLTSTTTTLHNLANNGAIRVRQLLKSIDSKMGLECFNEEAQPWMVHSSQTLRLFFRQPLPSRILLNEPILCSTFVANEFGLFSKTAFQDHQGLKVHAFILGQGAELFTVKLSPQSFGQFLPTSDSHCMLFDTLNLPENGKLSFYLKLSHNLVEHMETTKIQIGFRVISTTQNEESFAKSILPIVSMPISVFSEDISSDASDITYDESWCCRCLSVPELEKIVLAVESPGWGIAGKLWDGALVMIRLISAILNHSRSSTLSPEKILTGIGNVHVLIQQNHDSENDTLESSSVPLHISQGAKVVELGSGTGILGICMAYLGCNVLLTDLEENLGIMEKNLQLNSVVSETSQSTVFEAGSSHSKKVQIGHGKIEIVSHKWGESIEPIMNAFRQNPQGDISNPEDSSIDVLVMSDVVYHREGFEPLLNSMQALSSKNTQILMGHRRRNAEDAIFFELASHRFRVKFWARNELNNAFPSLSNPQDGIIWTDLCPDVQIIQFFPL